MKSRPMSAAAILALAATACNGPLTAIEVEITSDLKPPGEVSDVQVVLRTRGSVEREIFNGAWQMGTGKDTATGKNRLAFPFVLGFERANDSDVPLQLEVKAKYHGEERVTRLAHLEFEDGRVRRVRIELAQACIKHTCEAGKTCVPGFGCVRPGLKSDGTPMDPPNGDPCDCTSRFPLCVGATWTYRTVDATGSYDKTWFISDYGPIGSEPLPADLDPAGKKDVKAFLQLRMSPLERTRRWVSRGPNRDGPGTAIYWEKDIRYNTLWQPFDVLVHVPNRVRFDEARIDSAGPRAQWDVSYESLRFVVADGVWKKATTELGKDPWRVVSNTNNLRVPLRSEWGAAVCHTRIQDFGVAPPGTPETRRTFCFYTGIGKVLEYTERDRPAGAGPEILETERLLRWSVCGSGSVTYQ